MLRNRSETSSGGQVRSNAFLCPESGVRKAAWTVSESTTWALHKGGALGCAVTTPSWVPRPTCVPYTHPLHYSRAEQVDLKPDCFNSAVCPATNSAGVSNCLSKEQMNLTWVFSPAGRLSSCVALGKLVLLSELSLCHPSKENRETS